MARCLIILGIHRSGTSATAGALHELGIPMGHVLIGATEANAKGHYEDAEFTQINEQALGVWHTPVPNVPAFRLDYERHIGSRARGATVFGLKDPRTALTWEYIEPWVKSLKGVDDVRAIVVRRPFMESVKSLIKRDGWSRDRAIQIQSIYQYKLVETMERLKRSGTAMMGVDFGDLIADPQLHVGELADFCFEGIPHTPSRAELEAAAAFIDPSLRHHANTGAETEAA